MSDSLEGQRQFAARMNGEVPMNKTQRRQWREKQRMKQIKQDQADCRCVRVDVDRYDASYCPVHGVAASKGEK